jgi:hypothetical protein
MLSPDQATMLYNAACSILADARTATRHADSALHAAKAAEKTAEENLATVQDLIREMGVKTP